MVEAITADVLRLPVDEVPYGDPIGWLRAQVLGLEWPRVYDVLEYAVFNGNVLVDDALRAANQVLEREHSGYRFVGGDLTRVMHPAEAEGIEAAVLAARQAGLDGVHTHITQALTLFGKRPQPDYRNAIKEAISAVESTVKLIEGTRGGGLDKALDALSKRIEIHGALKSGLNSLYGFTSDEDGIRHPILDQPIVDEADARFMIVTCSAAVNWIIAKADKAGLLK